MAETTWTAPRRLYLDKNGKVVEANDPARATLLVAAGATIPIARAQELGLVGEKAAPAPPENKLRTGPAENKGAEEQIADLTARLEKSEAERADLRRQLDEQEEQLAHFQTLSTSPGQQAPLDTPMPEPPVSEPEIEDERSAGVQAEETPKRGKRG